MFLTLCEKNVSKIQKKKLSIKMKATNMSKVCKMSTGKVVNGNEISDIEEKVSKLDAFQNSHPFWRFMSSCLSRSAKQA